MVEPKKLTEMWAWVVEEPDGGEGIPASSRLMPGVYMPLIGGDEDRIRSLGAEAHWIASIGDRPLKLMRFTTFEVIERWPAAAAAAQQEH